MARTFRGEARNKVDSKGRVSIPPLFRRVLEAGDPDWAEGLQPQMVIVYGPSRQKYLECYSMARIAEIEAGIERLPLGSRQRNALETLYIGLTDTVSVDDTGRFVLPQKARQKLGLEDEARIIGKGNHFCIWHPADFEADVLAEAEEVLDSEQHPLTLLSQAAPAAEG